MKEDAHTHTHTHTRTHTHPSLKPLTLLWINDKKHKPQAM